MNLNITSSNEPQRLSRRSIALQRQLIARRRLKFFFLSLSSLLLIIVFLFCIVQFMNRPANTSQASELTSTTYTSIEVKAGDSLWELASSYKAPYMNTKTYLKEVIELNQMKSDQIEAGSYVIFPIYETAHQ